jgi:hypothetical protein
MSVKKEVGIVRVGECVCVCVSWVPQRDHEVCVGHEGVAILSVKERKKR